MHPYWTVLATVAAALASLLFSCLSYSLREFSRPRLAEHLARGGRSAWLEATVERRGDLAFVTAVPRLLANALILIGLLRLLQDGPVAEHHGLAMQYLVALLGTGLCTFFLAVAIPHVVAQYAGEALISLLVVPLHGLWVISLPMTKVVHTMEEMFRRAAGRDEAGEPERMEQQIEEEILSVVEEGEKEGVVDEDERHMIESAIHFRDTTAGQVMTARPEIVAIELGAPPAEVLETIERSGHSRLPVCHGTLDKIAGILYARDLLKQLGKPAGRIDIKAAIRPAFFVPETKPLPDLLRDFKLQKVHIAIVLDEYGGTAGLVTIEDLLEELVGEISDEHEPAEPAMLKQIGEAAWEADARVYIDELNRTLGLTLPEEEGYDTLGGFASTTLGRIPEKGESFEHERTKFTVLDAEPQKVNRLRLDLPPAAATDVPLPVDAAEAEKRATIT